MQDKSKFLLFLVGALMLNLCCALFLFAKPLKTPPVLRSLVIGREFYHRNVREGIETYDKYLGAVVDRKGRIVYYVVSEHVDVQAAIVKHGHDLIILYDNRRRVRHEYHECAELPICLKSNILQFATPRYNEKLYPELPKYLAEGYEESKD